MARLNPPVASTTPAMPRSRLRPDSRDASVKSPPSSAPTITSPAHDPGSEGIAVPSTDGPKGINLAFLSEDLRSPISMLTSNGERLAPSTPNATSSEQAIRGFRLINRLNSGSMNGQAHRAANQPRSAPIVEPNELVNKSIREDVRVGANSWRNSTEALRAAPPRIAAMMLAAKLTRRFASQNESKPPQGTNSKMLLITSMRENVSHG